MIANELLYSIALKFTTAGGIKENDSIMLGGFVAWCEKKCSDEVLGKWSFVLDANGFNQVDV